jgi:hypothetical protein
MSARGWSGDYVTQYSLAGIRAASTGPQEAFIKRAGEVLSDDDRILAGYLVGGFAVGLGDAFSDVDLQCCILDGAAEDLRSSWPTLAAEIAPLARVKPFGGPARGPFIAPIGGMCITPEWLHFDIVFQPQSSVDISSIVGMVPLFDKADLLPDTPVPRPDRRGDPFLPLGAVDHFLYMLGNVVSAIGRNEIIPAMNGVIMIRDIALVGLLLAEGGLATTREHVMGNPFPFTKRLRSYLTDEQNALLESLPPLAPNLDSVIDGYVALAEAFLPRAKRLAASTGSSWPTEYETASVAYFERMVGVRLRS